jgi:hypothetical protein
MIALKACPRGRGDLGVEGLLGELELVCLQCGYRRDLKQLGPALAAHIAGRAA